MVEKPNIAEPGKPRRRWYQFSLRMLLIGMALLSMPLGYAGWQAEIVRERRVMMEVIRKSGGSLYPFASVELFGDGPVLWCRKLFGDPGFGLVYIPEAMSKQAVAVQKMFPESTVAILRSSANPIERLMPERIVTPLQ
jgi:hypothetical protein